LPVFLAVIPQRSGGTCICLCSCSFLVVIPEGDLLLHLPLPSPLPVFLVVIPQRSGGICISPTQASAKSLSSPHHNKTRSNSAQSRGVEVIFDSLK
jgi:hypothetical protein